MTRFRYLASVVLTLVCLSTSLLFAQENQQPRRGRGQGNLFASPAILLSQAAVQEELKITDEQKKKLQTAAEMLRGAIGADTPREEREQKLKEIQESVKKTIDETLDDDQKKRLRQIVLQVRGAASLADAEVAKELSLSEDQTKQIKEIVEAQPARVEGAPRPTREEMQKRREERDAKLLALLTDEQKKKFEDLKGPKFDVSKLNFGQRRPQQN